tara:strand:+ start:7523 stop:8008 length:486 start_codon:yes stop_codon:yes gene_type:complete
MLLKVLIYAYGTGLFSSRKIAWKLEEYVAFRVLAAGNFPSPRNRTICDFRKQHLAAFEAVFVQVARIIEVMSCPRNCSTLRSDWARFGRRRRGWERIKRREARGERREARDEAKGQHPDDDRRSPRGGRNFKRDYGVPEDKDQSNFTDPQSRIMKTSEGFQ